MSRSLSSCLCAALLLVLSLAAQETDPVPPPAANTPGTSDTPGSPDTIPNHPLTKAQFFAGTVTALDEMHITVSRTLVGHAPESRNFSITKKTKLSKSVRVKSRVTVRFRREAEEDVALEIQVHSQPRASRPV